MINLILIFVRELKELFQDFQNADLTRRGSLDRIEFCEYDLPFRKSPLLIQPLVAFGCLDSNFPQSLKGIFATPFAL